MEQTKQVENMEVKLGKSSIYSPDGITIIPKLVREHLNITSNNYKKFELIWFIKNNQIVVEFKELEG